MKWLLFVLCFVPFASAHANAEPCSTTLPTVPFEGGYPRDLDDLRGGYWIRDPAGDCWFTPGLVSYSFWQETPTHYSTRAIWQADGVIEVNAALKGIDLSDVRGGVALNSCAYDGQRLWIRIPGGDWLPVRAVDCVHREHAYHHSVSVESALELSWALANELGVLDHVNEYGGVGMYGVEVCLREEPCSGEPVDYTEWFLRNVRYEESR